MGTILDRRYLRWAAGGALAVLALIAVVDFFDLPSKARTRLLSLLGGGPAPASESKRLLEIAPYLPLAAGEEAASIRLLDREIVSRGQRRAEKVSVHLDGHFRHAMAAVVPFGFRTSLTLPKEPELWLALNHLDTGLELAGLEFRVRVRDETGATPVLDLLLPAYQVTWQQVQIDLERWAGREVDLEFEVAYGAGHGESSSAPRTSARAFFGDLLVRSRVRSGRLPNVVVLLVDTLRPDHLGSYGYSRPTSPNIDRLAAEGVLFENAFSTSSWTNPSILSLFTSLYPSDLWAPGPHKEIIRNRLPESVDTLGTLLQQGGYFTVAASDHPGINARKFGRGFDVFVHLHQGHRPVGRWHETPPKPVLTQLAKLVAGRRGEGLLFYVHLLYPHRPYAAPEAYKGLFGPGKHEIDAANRQGLINLYDAEIRLADDMVGSFRRLLEEQNLLDDSILVLLSDHGEGFWEHGLEEHGNSLYNELLRIPLILRAPGRLPAGLTVDGVARIVDLVPTILEFVEIEPPSGLRGVSLEPLVAGTSSGSQLAFSEFPHSKMVLGQSLQSHSFKLIVSDQKDDRPETYDLRADSGELVVRSQDLEMEALLTALEEIRRSAVENRRAHLDSGLETSAEVLERLRALGYID